MESTPVSLHEFAAQEGARTGANRRRLTARTLAREGRPLKMPACVRFGSTLAYDRANVHAGSPARGGKRRTQLLRSVRRHEKCPQRSRHPQARTPPEKRTDPPLFSKGTAVSVA